MCKHGRTATERDRATIVLALGSGLSRKATARALHHARSTVIEVVKRFERGGRPTWSAGLFKLEVAERIGTTVSRTHMNRMLHEAGCRRVRPRPTIKLAPADKAERLAQLRAELDALPPEAVVLYEDEVDIHLNPTSGPDWTARGMRKDLVTPGQNAKWYFAGALDPKTRELTVMTGTRKNSDLFICLLQDLVERYRDRGVIHVVVDNYTIHRSKKTLKAVEGFGGKVVLHYLLPYSPDGDPIERVWLDLHDNVTRNRLPGLRAPPSGARRTRRQPDIESLVDSALNYLDHYDGRGAREVASLHGLKVAA
jgi:transposase